MPAGCDYLIITDSLLLPQARRLADLRAFLSTDSIARPAVATMADIYKAYPHARARFESILGFLKDLDKDPDGLPRHLTLFGDASETENSHRNHVPTLVRRSRQSFGEDLAVSFDDAYSQLLDTVRLDSLLPRIAIGRIPAHTVAEARAYVDKVMRYEADFSYGPEAFTYGYAADDDLRPGGPELISDLAHQHQFLWDALGAKPFVCRMVSLEFPLGEDNAKPLARDSLAAMWNSGLSRFYYVGHGHQDQLSDEKLFRIPADLALLKPSRQMPIAVLAACTTSPFVIDSISSIGESLLFHPDGAIAVLGGVEENYPMPNLELFRRWDAYASAGGTLGESFRKARTDSGGNIFYSRNSLTYTLLGDPGLTLRNPGPRLVPILESDAREMVFREAGSPGDSIHYRLVRVDSIPYAPLLFPDAFSSLQDLKYLRETTVFEGRSVIGPGGSVPVSISPSADVSASALKIMVWNAKGMRYGHVPLASLRPVGLRKRTQGIAKGAVTYSLARSGGRLVVRRSGPDGVREADLLGARLRGGTPNP